MATALDRTAARLKRVALEDPEPPRDMASELGHQCDYRFELVINKLAGRSS